jgi:hypothetical protein
MARWYWLQSKGAVKIEWKYSPSALKKYPDFILTEKYQEYSNMFSKYCEWTSFEEKKLSEITGISLDQMRKDMTKILDQNYQARMKCFEEPIDFGIKQDDFDSLISDASKKF